MATMLGHWQLRGYGIWAAEEKSNGSLVGRIGFINSEGWPGFELAWTLGRPHWGRGYATEGARAALEYAFTKLDQPHVISLIHPDNTASIRVAERIGERFERTADHFGTQVGVYGIHRD
jgi:RimJ/RimL family protein N-acetyltransferase